MTEYEVACLGKVRFPNRRTAKHRSSQLRREGKAHMRPYACHFCGQHHLGNLPGHATYLRRGIPLQELTQ